MLKAIVQRSKDLYSHKPFVFQDAVSREAKLQVYVGACNDVASYKDHCALPLTTTHIYKDSWLAKDDAIVDFIIDTAQSRNDVGDCGLLDQCTLHLAPSVVCV
ncbi:hypothetical protein PI125_g8655 [Phytophthora idaei]|nr:hypothetical protein PI125_g8655 [Phytophthora idaei]